MHSLQLDHERAVVESSLLDMYRAGLMVARYKRMGFQDRAPTLGKDHMLPESSIR